MYKVAKREPDSDEAWLAKNPHLRGFAPLLKMLNAESDRGRVLVAVSFIEEQLGEILRAFMLEVEGVAPLLGGYNAPLGALSARTTAAHALALISDAEHAECNILRRVRNEFAHNHRATFKDRRVIDLCEQLTFKAPDYTKKDGVKITVDPGQFTTAATSLILNFVNRAYYVGKHKISPRQWPV